MSSNEEEVILRTFIGFLAEELIANCSKEFLAHLAQPCLSKERDVVMEGEYTLQ